MGVGYNWISKSGFWWDAVYDVLYTYITNWNAALAKLDTDTGDTTWATTYGITSPSIGATYGKDITPLAFPQGKVVALLKAMRDNFNSVMDAVAADDGVDGTTIFTNLKFASTTRVVDTYGARIKALGDFQDEVVSLLDDLQDKFDTFLEALDADATLTDVDYALTYAIADVVEASSSSSSSRSSSSSSSSSSRSSSSSSSSSCSSSSSSSSRSSSSSSSRSSSSSSRSSSSSSSSRSSSSSSSSSRSSSSSSSSRSSSSSSSSSRSSSSSSSSSSRSSSSSCSSSSSSSSSKSSSCSSSSSSSSSLSSSSSSSGA